MYLETRLLLIERLLVSVIGTVLCFANESLTASTSVRNVFHNMLIASPVFNPVSEIVRIAYQTRASESETVTVSVGVRPALHNRARLSPDTLIVSLVVA